MNRRGFLKLLGGAAAAGIVAPKVSYFFAPQGGWQSDVIEHAPITINGLQYWVSPESSLEYCGISRDPIRLSTPLAVVGAPLTLETVEKFWRRMDRLASDNRTRHAQMMYGHPAEIEEIRRLMKRPSLLDRLLARYAA